MLQPHIGEILTQTNAADFLQPLTAQALLHIVIKDALCRRLIALTEQIFQADAHSLRHELVFCDHRPGQPVLYIQAGPQAGEKKRKPQERRCILQIFFLYTGYLLVSFHIDFCLSLILFLVFAWELSRVLLEHMGKIGRVVDPHRLTDISDTAFSFLQ